MSFRLHISQYKAVQIGIITGLEGWNDICGAFEDYDG